MYKDTTVLQQTFRPRLWISNPNFVFMGVNCVFLLWGSVNLLVNLCSTLIPVLFLCCSYHENETKHIYSLREAHWHIYMCVFNEQTRSILDLHGNTKCSVTLYLLASSVFRVGYPGYHQLSAVCVHLYVGTFWCRKESPVSSRAIVSLYVRFPSEINIWQVFHTVGGWRTQGISSCHGIVSHFGLMPVATLACSSLATSISRNLRTEESVILGVLHVSHTWGHTL